MLLFLQMFAMSTRIGNRLDIWLRREHVDDDRRLVLNMKAGFAREWAKGSGIIA